MSASDELSPFRTYAHWLDSEFLKQTSWGQDPTDARWRKHVAEWEKRLKISLLFGFEFLLSDVQVVDSRLLLHLFSSEGFRRFVGRFPATMILRSSPLSSTGDRVRPKAVLAGLERSLHPEWISSTFATPDPTQRVAELVLASDDLDTDLVLHSPKFREVLDTTPPAFRGLLGSIPYVCDHFLRTRGSWSLPPSHSGPPRSYFDVLLEARDRSSGDTQQGLAEVVGYLEERLEGSELFRRSRVKTLLDEEIGSGLDNRYRKVWHSVIDAWNMAVQEHIAGDAGGSVSQLAYSPGVSLLLGVPGAAIDLHRAAAETVEELKVMRESRFQFPAIEDLAWGRFTDVFDATTATREALRESRVQGGDAVEVDRRLESHARAVGDEIMPGRGATEWLDFGISLAALFSGDPIVATAGGVKAVYEMPSSSLRALRKRQLVKTLTWGGRRLVDRQSKGD